jgi:hypothetical protein
MRYGKKPYIQIPIKTPQCLKLNFDFRVSVKNAVTALKFAFYVNIRKFYKVKVLLSVEVCATYRTADQFVKLS